MAVLGYLMGALGHLMAWRQRQGMAKWCWAPSMWRGTPFQGPPQFRATFSARIASLPWPGPLDIRERPLDSRERPLASRVRPIYSGERPSTTIEKRLFETPMCHHTHAVLSHEKAIDDYLMAT